MPAPSAAEVRWLIVQPDGARSAVHAHATTAPALAFTTGIGPWPLAGNGMKAWRLGERAVFVWHEPDAVTGVTSDGSTPTTLATDADGALITFRSDQLLLFDSSPRVRAFELSCD